MFDLINRNAEFIVNSIPLDHLADYDWLLRHKEECGSPEYRRRFRNYWSMNPAQLGTTFYDAYFEMLGRPYGSSPSLQEVCRSLYDASTRRNGTKVLQFSFATKLLHMRDQRLPIYDSMVAKFFFFEPPDPDKELSRRIEALAEFYSFLAREYERVQRELLMQRAVAPDVPPVLIHS